MTLVKRKSLASVLYRALPIPKFMRLNLYVERALQERAVAAQALSSIHVKTRDLRAEIETMTSQSPEGRATLIRIQMLLEDIDEETAYNDSNMMKMQA